MYIPSIYYVQTAHIHFQAVLSYAMIQTCIYMAYTFTVLYIHCNYMYIHVNTCTDYSYTFSSIPVTCQVTGICHFVHTGPMQGVLAAQESANLYILGTDNSIACSYCLSTILTFYRRPCPYGQLSKRACT